MEQTLGKRISHHRKLLGLTQDQLAEQLGVTAQAVSKWENDQSCPDISTLPQLADIFSTSVDALLGREDAQQALTPELVTEDEEDEPEGLHIEKNGFEFHYDSGRRGALGFAILVLAVGIQLFLASLLQTGPSFWKILWPTALLTFGLFGMRVFGFTRLGCILFGGYFLLDNWDVLPFQLGGNLAFPLLIIIFGVSLFVDALKKPSKPHFHCSTNSKEQNDYREDNETFEYSARFGECEQTITLPRLSYGRINTSFGDYSVDLTEVEEVAEDCHIEANCSFGELELLVPRRYTVKLNSSTAFGEISTSGHPDSASVGTIYLKAHANFGEITLRYI